MRCFLSGDDDDHHHHHHHDDDASVDGDDAGFSEHDSHEEEEEEEEEGKPTDSCGNTIHTQAARVFNRHLSKLKVLVSPKQIRVIPQ